MKMLLTLSAHLDDAAFSVGPLLAKLAADVRIVVATVFTKSVANPQGFALACQLDKGLPATVDYMAIRRNEDLEWSEMMGIEAIHGPFVEAPHRGYQSAPALFGSVLPTDEIAVDLQNWLNHLIESHTPDAVLIPLGLGNHVDHQWVRRVAEASPFNQQVTGYYKDQPYAVKSNQASMASYPTDTSLLGELRVPLCATSLTRALNAAESYRTQIPFQFGGVDQMKSLLSTAWGQHLSIYHDERNSAAIQFLKQPI